jgi:hypothetical protein
VALEELSDNLIYRLRIGDRPHVAEVSKLHKLDARQSGRQ